LHPTTPDAADYLEKILQIPYWVRRLDSQTSSDFILGLIADARRSRDDADNEVPDDRSRTQQDAGTGEATPVETATPVNAGSEPFAPPHVALDPATNAAMALGPNGGDDTAQPRDGEPDLSPGRASLSAF